MRAWVAEGEHQQQDFKYAVIDALKIARSVSAFANRDGGRLLIGVKDNGVIAGVRNEEDAYVVETAAQIYCKPSIPINFHAYSIDTGISIIVAEIAPSPDRPVYVVEANGRRRAYWRVADENIAAHPLMVRSWQRRNSSAPLILGREHGALLDLVAQSESIVADTRNLALTLHLSEHRVADLIVELTAAETLEFAYKHGNFVIRQPQQDLDMQF